MPGHSPAATTVAAVRTIANLARGGQACRELDHRTGRRSRNLIKSVVERQQARNDPMSQQGQWQVAGSAPEVYERELVPAVFRPWAPILVDLAHPRPGERVVDVACGTGVVARIVAARVGPKGTVVGVDLNPGMLSVARSAVSTDPRASAPVQWQEASADKLPFPDGSFDIVYCQLGLQFFVDRAAALCEMRRVL